jgi:hypothetical protein
LKKKKQKTFASFSLGRETVPANLIKVFLVLFLQKKNCLLAFQAIA